jgi:hypothetical protein
MDRWMLGLIVVFCVVLAAYIYVRSQRLSKKNKK